MRWRRCSDRCWLTKHILRSESESQPLCKRCVSVSQPVSRPRPVLRKTHTENAGSLQIVESWPCKHLAACYSGTFHCDRQTYRHVCIYLSLARISLQRSPQLFVPALCRLSILRSINLGVSQEVLQQKTGLRPGHCTICRISVCILRAKGNYRRGIDSIWLD